LKTRTEAFHDWLKSSTPGQVYTYYTGFLAVDRGTIVDVGDGVLEFIPNEAVDDLGRLALSAFEDNRVHLFQRKIHDRVYEYIAMKRRDGGRIW
jgi:hypothetical protein